VNCSYADPTTGANLAILTSPASGTTASALKSVANSQDQAQSTTATPISGFGSAAYIFALHDASSNSSGVATTIMMILDGSKLVDNTAEATPAHVPAVAHYFLSH
jgi:hypothetical protein